MMTPNNYNSLPALNVRSLLRGKEIKGVYVYVRLTSHDGCNVWVSKACMLRIMRMQENDCHVNVFRFADNLYFG